MGLLCPAPPPSELLLPPSDTRAAQGSPSHSCEPASCYRWFCESLVFYLFSDHQLFPNIIKFFSCCCWNVSIFSEAGAKVEGFFESGVGGGHVGVLLAPCRDGTW